MMIDVVLPALSIIAFVALVYLAVEFMDGARFDNVTCRCSATVVRRVLILNRHDRTALTAALTTACPCCQSRDRKGAAPTPNPQSATRNPQSGAPNHVT